MSKTIWSDAEAQLRPIMSNGLIDLPSNSKFSVKDLNYNFDKIINVNNAINNLNEINEHIANTHIHMSIDDIPQSDWNQNDDTAADYIKNKTHWSEVEEVTLLNDSLTFSSTFAENPGMYRYITVCDFLIEDNKTYTVIFDDVKYTCTSVLMNPENSITVIGNLGLTGMGNDTGEPFFIVTQIVDGDYVLVIGTTLTEATHSVIIKTINETIHKLDTKYLKMDDSLSATSINPVENRVITEAISEITPDIYAGKSWTQSNITSGNFNDVYYGNGIWVAANGHPGSGLCYSIDGITWTQSNITDGKFNCIYYDNGIWVAGSNGDFGLCYSIDGMTWTQSNITNGKFNCVYYANGIWVAGNYTNGLYYSTDGKTWTQSNITSNNIYCIYYDNGIWVAGGTDSSDGIIYYSIDGITWAPASIELKV